MSRFLLFTLGVGDQLPMKPQTLTMFSFSFIQQVFFSIYYVSGMVARVREIDYLTLGSPQSSRGHV